MGLEVWIFLAFVAATPLALGFLINRVARAYFSAGAVARSPRLVYVFVVAAWLLSLALIVVLRSAPPAASAPTVASPPPAASPAPTASPPPLSSPPDPYTDMAASAAPASVSSWWFPWPPPTPSARASIAVSRVLSATSIEGRRLGEVDAALTRALVAAGHHEASYYGVPRGFAVVTRLESIQASGMPKPGDLRWDIRTRAGRPFSLESYIEALFFAPAGRYRVIVFVVTAERFATVDRIVEREDASRWLRVGANALPLEMLSQPVEQGTLCTALIYEFWKESDLTAWELLRPGQISAERHIVGTGLQGLLQ